MVIYSTKEKLGSCLYIGWLKHITLEHFSYTTCSSEIHGKNQWNHPRKDNFIINTRYEYVPIRNTQGKYRKLMKRGYYKLLLLYSQLNKDETIVSVIKRLFGEHITSRLVKTQNRELSFRCIAYNIQRLTNIIVIFRGFY